MVQTRRATRLVTGTDEDQVSSEAHAIAKPHARKSSRSIKREQTEPKRPTTRKRVRKDSEQPDERDLKPSVQSSDTNLDKDGTGFEAGPPAKRPRKARSKKDGVPPKPSDFAPRVSSLWKVGAHVSAAGGVENAIVNAARVRANAFALFVKSQRKWSSPALTNENIACFKARMGEFGYEPKYVLPHGSYLINLANPDAEKREKSYECFLDDIRRCEQLGLILYNFHPGSTVGNATKEESIALVAQCINRAHKETSLVTIVIENMSGAKNIIGSQFTELRDIIEQVEDKSRVGVCLDTCHLYAAGYDISTNKGWDETITTFDDQVGLSYLRGMHLNDSKTPLNSKKDRHENIGMGTIEISSFFIILSDPRVRDIPLILETPSFEAVEVWETEIEVLNRLSQIGSESGGGCEDENSSRDEDTGKKVELEELVGEIQGVVRKHCDGMGKTGKGKGKTTRMSKSKQGAKARKKQEVDGDGEDGDEEGEDSCGEQSE